MPPPFGRLTYLWSVRDVRRNRRSHVAGFSIVPFAAAARPRRDGVCQLRRKTGKEKNEKKHSILLASTKRYMESTQKSA